MPIALRTRGDRAARDTSWRAARHYRASSEASRPGVARPSPSSNDSAPRPWDGPEGCRSRFRRLISPRCRNGTPVSLPSNTQRRPSSGRNRDIAGFSPRRDPTPSPPPLDLVRRRGQPWFRRSLARALVSRPRAGGFAPDPAASPR